MFAIAEKHKIPLREDLELPGSLATVDLGQELPLYLAVAQIIAFAHHLRRKSPPRSDLAFLTLL
jgi:flagellar biosynthesis protein